ncbi:MAG: cytochrome c oxidase subunit II [Ktedonobacteraceae bacterium]
MRTSLFRGKRGWGLLVPAVLFSSLLIASCGGPGDITNTAGPVAGKEAGLFWFILIVATIIFVVVEGWLILTIVRYRARPNTPEPRQLHGNNTIEIIWTVVPSLFLFAVLAGTIYTMFGLQQPAGNHLEVKAVGHQWWWEFDYPAQHIVTADTLYVPKGTVVQVDLVSNNVIHSFWIPQLTGKTDVIPGHNNTRWFTADKAGTYIGKCAEYCGTQHAHMGFNVVVYDTADQFNTWVSSQQQAAANSSDALAQQGLKIFKGAGGCTGCHGIVGVNLNSFDDSKGQALVGPNLTHFGSRSLIAGDVLAVSNGPGNGHSWANDPACQLVNGKLANPEGCGLYKWLHDPQGVKPGNDMVIGQLSDAQIYALIAYLQSLQ